MTTKVAELPKVHMGVRAGDTCLVPLGPNFNTLNCNADMHFTADMRCARRRPSLQMEWTT